MPPLFLCIEGNIGVGKTSTMRRVAELLQQRGLTVRCEYEECARWRRWGIFDDLYHRPSDASTVSFEVLGPALDIVKRVERLRASACDVVIWERHARTITDVFTVVAATPGYTGPPLSPERREGLLDVLRACGDNLFRVPDVLVYLRAKPDTCLQRVVLRDRVEESGVDTGMLRQLHEAHDRFVAGYDRSRTRVVEIDSDSGNVEAIAGRVCALV